MGRQGHGKWSSGPRGGGGRAASSGGGEPGLWELLVAEADRQAPVEWLSVEDGAAGSVGMPKLTESGCWLLRLLPSITGATDLGWAIRKLLRVSLEVFFKCSSCGHRQPSRVAGIWLNCGPCWIWTVC